MRRKHRQLVAAIEKKVGPFTGGDVLVLRGIDAEFGPSLLEELLTIAQARGFVGSPLACEYVPLVVYLADDSASIELLDEDDMRAAGWVRA